RRRAERCPSSRGDRRTTLRRAPSESNGSAAVSAVGAVRARSFIARGAKPRLQRLEEVKRVRRVFAAERSELAELAEMRMRSSGLHEVRVPEQIETERERDDCGIAALGSKQR